ncbi:MAG: TetR/AcrR family transcriptional regulator [Chloroflexi bacterium]|nr:TetR/AcrR family transcriptional regulator [Chloroflexota bacterium]
MKAEKLDRRSLRTRQLLSDALVSLLLEQRYDTITVQEIIDRANVGRSTFYKHFYDKDDLLASNLEALLEHMSATITLDDTPHSALLPSRKLFEHVGDYRALYQALVRAKRIDMMIEAGQRNITRNIERQLQQRNLAVPNAALAHYLAGSFFALLRWWLDHDAPYTAAQMENMFQALVRPGLEQVLRDQGEVQPGTL